MPKAQRQPATSIYTIRSGPEKSAELVPNVAVKAEGRAGGRRASVEIVVRGLVPENGEERTALLAYFGEGDAFIEASDVSLSQIDALISALTAARAKLPDALAKRQTMAAPVAAFRKLWDEAQY